MLHPFSKTVTKTLRGVLGALLLLVACLITPHAAQTAEDLHKILSLQSKVTGNETEIRLQGDSPFVSSVYELPKPVRVVVDVANAVLAENFILPGDTPFRVATTKVAGTNPGITRFEIYVPELVSFASRQEGKDTILTIESKDSPLAAQQADFGVVELPKTTFTGLSVRRGKVKPEFISILMGRFFVIKKTSRQKIHCRTHSLFLISIRFRSMTSCSLPKWLIPLSKK